MDNSIIIRQIKSGIERLEEITTGNSEKSDSHSAAIIEVYKKALRIVEDLERTIEGQHQCSATMISIYQRVLRIREELNSIEDDFMWIKTIRENKNQQCCCKI